MRDAILNEPTPVTSDDFQQKLEAHFRSVILAEYDPKNPPWLFTNKEKQVFRRAKPAFEFRLTWFNKETGEEFWTGSESIEVQFFDEDSVARRVADQWAHALNLKLGIIKAKRYSLHRADESPFID